MLKHGRKFYLALIIISALIAILPGDARSQDQGHKKLEYEVSVSAQLVPVLAVDGKGNPVYDLKQEELELIVNGKPTGIIFFNGYRLDMTEASRARKRVIPVKAKIPERLHFIVLDTMISNMNTMGLARVIAMRIIEKATSGDAFVILESNQDTALQHVVGPEKNRKKLFKAMKEIENRFKRRNMEQKFMRELQASSRGSNAERIAAQFLAIGNNKAAREREKYQNDIRRFAYSLKQLKYALKTTTLPKTVYLISPGPRANQIAENQVTYMRFLEDSAKAINHGGGLFFVINPLKQKKSGGGSQLKFMADAAGGKFISGTGIKDVVSQVKKSTSAYYELAFNSKAGPGKKNKINLTCKRKGVHLTSIAHSEQGRPYKSMNSPEKRLFVLNIVSGGSWSRMVTPVQQLTYKTLDASTGKNGFTTIKKIQLDLPLEMMNRKLHIYQVAVEATTRKVNFKFAEKAVKESEGIVFEITPGKFYYFVMIDPIGNTCVFNRVM